MTPALDGSELSTYYIPTGETRTVQFCQLRRGQDSARSWWADDNGTLLAVVTVEQAETDEPLLLKQFSADRLIRQLLVLEASDAWNPAEEAVRIQRGEDRYAVDVA